MSARMRPPCASMMDREIGRPMPMPASLVVKKVSKSRGICVASIPGPLSSIVQHTVSGFDSMVRIKMLRRAVPDTDPVLRYEPWGERSVWLADPSGIVVRLVEWVPPAGP